MTPTPDRLTAALADRYRFERELGAGSGSARALFSHYNMAIIAR